MRPAELRSRLVTNGIATLEELRGCTPREIEELEQAAERPLPCAYKDFLLVVGHQKGRFLRGTDTLYPYVARLTDAARELLAENGLQGELPEDAFVFYLHQGYEFGYFRFAEGDDPPVYQYFEGKGLPKLVWPSFTNYLVYMIRSYTDAIKREAR